MPLKLMYITNRPDIASIADKYGVDRIFVDLETIGKEARQHNMNTVKSHHTFEDISALRNVLNKSELLVRVNPMYEGTKAEVNEAIERGAEIVMLPMLKTREESERFIDYVSGRSKTMLLVETAEAEEKIEEIASIDGADEIYIGLNDLHLAHKQKFMFQLLADGNVDRMSKAIKNAGKPYGFGGIASIDQGMLPGKYVIADHYRLGSSISILSRSFYIPKGNDSGEHAEQVFRNGMRIIRDYENELLNKDADFFQKNHLIIIQKVKEIIGN